MPHRISGLSATTWRAIAAVMLAALLGLMALPTVRAEAAEMPTTVTGGTLSWGLKSSFRSYLTGPIAHGTVSTTAPATDNGTQTTFASAKGSWSGDAASVETSGGVRFTGHDGELDVTLSRPRLVVDGSSARLLVDAKDSDGRTHTDLAIADLALSGRVTTTDTSVTISNAPATLTKAGEVVFSYQGSPMYTAGTALDPVSASLTVDPPTDPDPTPTPDPDPTPTPDPDPTTPPSTDVTAGTITWGLRQSFRTYVVGPIAHGSITVQPPATKSADNVVTWSGATGQWSDSTKQVGAKGSVTYYGHDGELNLTLSSPQLKVSGSAGQLILDVKDSEGVVHDDVAFATIALSGRLKVTADGVTVSGAPATLTAAGATVMNGFYAAGETLDPLTAAFALGDAQVPTPPPAESTPTQKPRPTPTKKPKADSPDATRSGALTWGVKASFRSYITGPIAKGSISVSGGAAATSGAYRFGQSSTTAKPPAATGTTDFRGGVRFYGHHGELDLTISQPSVRVTSSTSATLSAQVGGRGRIDLAVLDLERAGRSTAPGWVQFANTPATLTASGSSLFSYNGNAFYPAGTVLDPVTFSIGSTASAGSGGGSGTVTAAAAADDDWTPPSTPPATTGLTVEQDEIRAGDEITASGSGFLPNETGIRVVLYSSPIVLAEDVTADASGKASWTGTIPATVEPGTHTLTFQGSVDRGIVLDIAAAEEVVGCALTDGRLDWGFKESFRAYVSGSIANGDWTTEGNASYQTPIFTWAKGEGVRDDQTGAGKLEFTGAIRFSGHDGALDTTIANPVITLTDAKTAVLSVDYSGTTMEAAMAGKDAYEEKPDVPFVDLDLSAGTVTENGSVVTIADIPTTLTAAGSAAFPNYETGAAFDPVTLTFTVADQCETVAAAAPAPASGGPDTLAAPVSSASSGVPAWFSWIGGALVGAVVACAGTVLVMRRRVTGATA